MIHKISLQLGKEILLKKALPIKRTARCPIQYVCEIGNEGLFLVVIAKTRLQKFYLARSIEKQEEFYQTFKNYYQLNMKVYSGSITDFDYVVYPYFKNVAYPGPIDSRPLLRINDYYIKYAETCKVNDNLIGKIESDFLDAWPNEFHKQIKDLEEYKKYFSHLNDFEELQICKEHGQYGYANILYHAGTQYLVDFEFAKNFQPVGFDYYDYLEHMFCVSRLKYTNKQAKITNQLKLNLVDCINNIVDNSKNIIITKITENKAKELMGNVFPNVILNRFDLLFGGDFELYCVNGEYVPVRIEEHISSKHIGPLYIKSLYARLGIYLRDIGMDNLAGLLLFLYRKYKLTYIDVVHTYTALTGSDPAPHWHIELPKTIEEFNASLSGNQRYNNRKHLKRINDELGGYIIKRYVVKEVSLEIMKKYFLWKCQRFKFRYDKSPAEYLTENGITDVFVMFSGVEKQNEILAIGFVCITQDNAFFDNFAFNVEYARYSVGTILFYQMIAALIEDKKQNFFLFGSEREYKRHANGIKTFTYSNRYWHPWCASKKKLLSRLKYYMRYFFVLRNEKDLV
jgi:hypothetical protein